MLSQEHAAADIAAAPSGPGPEAIRRALRGPPGRVALRLAAPAGTARRRVAITLLEEAGRSHGGVVLTTATGELLLTEAAPDAAARAEALLERLLGTAPERLDLPGAVATLLALPASVPVPSDPPPVPAGGIEALADAAPLAALLRRDGVLHIAPQAPRRLALMRLRLPSAALAPHLGPAAADADLARHARDRLRARLLAWLAEPARRAELLGAAPPVPLLVDLPAALLPDPPAPTTEEPPAPPALIAALSPAEALAEGLAARRAALRHAGWGLAVRGLDAAALALLAPEELPADLLLLRWSPALAGRAANAALRRTDPARLVLTGCDGPEALEWGLSIGVARYAGRWIAALMAATRMAVCPRAAGCTRAECVARGAAATRDRRAGCGAPALLGALMPAEPGA
ncbi:hypothetical protein GXW74_11530 [Roseomonas eburnea]|uniref:Uncharacterized protein n=1 Tax=Neoroseomonas eburnea TaxID=1346889 RepID=A0A9X9XBN4_9PROT|nr:hypothetical protein [Neoroseomonas eburnea]MBR0681120.1 hypothetical protein [Neoroseomonas eburnea]